MSGEQPEPLSGEQPEPLSGELVVRTARKSWSCEACGALIEPGDRHLEYLGEAHAYESGSRYCAGCANTVWGVAPAHFAE
jgi:hypothetical protein